MTFLEISNTRLFSQKIAATEFTSAKEMVGWMGAMQAQDYTMAKWALGTRLLNSTDEMVENAFNKGDIIRTHLMRPTWHFVSADDIYWMNNLSAFKIKSKLKSRHHELELSDSIISKSNTIFEKALLKGENLTREEMAAELERANVKPNNNQLYHLLFCAELDGIVCSGKMKGGKQTYALLSERVPFKRDLTKDESLAELAIRYFTSRCPATIDDFAWWSGLTISDAKNGLELVKSGFISETIDSMLYWFPISFSNAQSDKTSVHLLPAFDEFLISYKNRSASLSLTDNLKAVSSNGVFHPIVVRNGQVIGIWKRTIKKEKVIVEISFFQSPEPSTKSLVEIEAYRFGQFIHKITEVYFQTE
jgi:hypothetical protein